MGKSHHPNSLFMLLTENISFSVLKEYVYHIYISETIVQTTVRVQTLFSLYLIRTCMVR